MVDGQQQFPSHPPLNNGPLNIITAPNVYPHYNPSGHPGYSGEFHFPQRNDSHSGQAGTPTSSGPPSASSPSPAFSNASVTTPTHERQGPFPGNMYGAGQRPPIAQGGSYRAGRPSPGPDNASVVSSGSTARDSGHPYRSANGAGQKARNGRRHTSDPNGAGENTGGGAPDGMAHHAQRKASYGHIAGSARGPRRSATTPKIPEGQPGPSNYTANLDVLLPIGGPAPGPPSPYGDNQQQQHPQQRSLNSPHSHSHSPPEGQLTASGSSGTPISESSLAAWNSTENLPQMAANNAPNPDNLSQTAAHMAWILQRSHQPPQFYDLQSAASGADGASYSPTQTFVGGSSGYNGQQQFSQGTTSFCVAFRSRTQRHDSLSVGNDTNGFADQINMAMLASSPTQTVNPNSIYHHSSLPPPQPAFNSIQPPPPGFNPQQFIPHYNPQSQHHVASPNGTAGSSSPNPSPIFHQQHPNGHGSSHPH